MEPTQHSSEAEVSGEYETPAIEQVVTPDDVTREVHYAGIGGPSEVTN